MMKNTLRSYLSYNYARFQADPLTFDTQKACLKRHVLTKFDREKRANKSYLCTSL